MRGGIGRNKWKSKFKELVETEGALQFVDEHVLGVAKGVDPVILEGLNAHFMGECTEVGMYLAMSLSSVCVVMNALRLKRFKAHPAHAAAEQGAPLSPMPAQPRAERIELPQNENINKNDREEKQMKTITLIIEGMMCQNCRSHVDKALNGISGVAANVSLEEKKAVCTVEDGVSADTLKAAVEDAGYTVISVE